MGGRKAYMTVHPIRVLDVRVNRRLETDQHSVRKVVGRQVAFLHQRLAVVDNLRDVLRESAQLVGCYDQLQAYLDAREKQRSGAIAAAMPPTPKHKQLFAKAGDASSTLRQTLDAVMHVEMEEVQRDAQVGILGIIARLEDLVDKVTAIVLPSVEIGGRLVHASTNSLRKALAETDGGRTKSAEELETHAQELSSSAADKWEAQINSTSVLDVNSKAR